MIIMQFHHQNHHFHEGNLAQKSIHQITKVKINLCYISHLLQVFYVFIHTISSFQKCFLSVETEHFLTQNDLNLPIEFHLHSVIEMDKFPFREIQNCFVVTTLTFPLKWQIYN